MQLSPIGDALAVLRVYLDQFRRNSRALSEALAAEQRRRTKLWAAIGRSIEEAIANAMEEEEELQLLEREARERIYGELWD